MQAVVSFAGPAVDQEEGSAKSHLHSCKASWPWDVGLSDQKSPELPCLPSTNVKDAAPHPETGNRKGEQVPTSYEPLMQGVPSRLARIELLCSDAVHLHTLRKRTLPRAGFRVWSLKGVRCRRFSQFLTSSDDMLS